MQVTIIGLLIVANISTNNDIESFRPIDYIITSALRMVYIEYAYIWIPPNPTFLHKEGS
jgi:hypothetical protein